MRIGFYTASAAALLREAAHDLFALGTAEARADGQRAGERAVAVPSTVDLNDAPVDAAAVGRALDLVASPFLTLLAAGERDKVRDECPDLPGGELVLAAAPPDRAFAAGVDLHRLRAALAAQGLATAWRDVHPAQVTVPAGALTLGLLAIGLPG